MNSGKFVFSQIMGLVSSTSFQTLVHRYKGDYKVKDFSCWKQYLCMAFGQLTHRESLSDTMLCLKANADKLYHLGIGDVVAKSTLSTANENRSYLIYFDLSMLLIKQAKQLYLGNSDLEVELDNNVFAIDATTIDLCLSTFYWATFRSTKGGIKLHTQLDLKTSIPEFRYFSTASVHDVNALDFISFEANSFYIMDRGYVDYKRLYKIDCCEAFYITRAKDNEYILKLLFSQGMFYSFSSPDSPRVVGVWLTTKIRTNMRQRRCVALYSENFFIEDRHSSKFVYS